VTELRTLLLEARERGYLGDQPVERQVEHGRGFARVCEALAAGLSADDSDDSGPDPATHHAVSALLDLGAGGGIPGLVLALDRRRLAERIVLLEGSIRRAEWLEYAVEELELAAGVEVVGERAEIAGRLAEHRQRYSIVVARSFARPGVTAECAAPFLQTGGYLLVSEPPAPDEVGSAPTPVPTPRDTPAQSLGLSPEVEKRWPSELVRELGFGPPAEWRSSGFRYAALEMSGQCPERYPRRNGIPSKRPLF
jgi:16S rRNA (guanine527-N7)-methyltransferase